MCKGCSVPEPYYVASFVMPLCCDCWPRSTTALAGAKLQLGGLSEVLAVTWVTPKPGHECHDYCICTFVQHAGPIVGGVHVKLQLDELREVLAVSISRRNTSTLKSINHETLFLVQTGAASTQSYSWRNCGRCWPCRTRLRRWPRLTAHGPPPACEWRCSSSAARGSTRCMPAPWRVSTVRGGSPPDCQCVWQGSCLMRCLCCMTQQAT